MINNHRSAQRYQFSLPIHLSFGSQITLLGQIKDLSLKSAFIIVKSSIHMAIHDDLKFLIGNPTDEVESRIEGSARISRVAVGEGIAIYFTQMDGVSTKNLLRMIGNGGA